MDLEPAEELTRIESIFVRQRTSSVKHRPVICSPVELPVVK